MFRSGVSLVPTVAGHFHARIQAFTCVVFDFLAHTQSGRNRAVCKKSTPVMQSWVGWRKGDILELPFPGGEGKGSACWETDWLIPSPLPFLRSSPQCACMLTHTAWRHRSHRALPAAKCLLAPLCCLPRPRGPVILLRTFLHQGEHKLITQAHAPPGQSNHR